MNWFEKILDGLGSGIQAQGRYKNEQADRLDSNTRIAEENAKQAAKQAEAQQKLILTLGALAAVVFMVYSFTNKK